MRKEMRYPECSTPNLVSTFDPVRNCCNDQYVEFGNNMEDHIRYISSMKHMATVMFLSLVCSNKELSPPILFDGGYWLNADRYINVMTSTIIPWMRKIAGKTKFVFQQDGALAQTANMTQAFLEKKIDFWPKSMGPPQSPDLNPLDYGVWWQVESSACKTQSQNVKELKAHITENWANLDKGYVVDVCHAFRGC